MAAKAKPTDSLYTYRCWISRVIDGDTVEMEIDLGLGVWSKRQKGRLRDVWAPEIRQAHGAVCKAELEAVLKRDYGFALCQTHLDKRDGFARLVVEVWVGSGNAETDVNEHMRQFIVACSENKEFKQ